MIFITPKTVSKPDRDDEQDRGSGDDVEPEQHEAGPRGAGCARSSLSLLQIRTLLARVDVLERSRDLHRAVALHLAEIHRERRMMLLVHPDLAARAVERDLGRAPSTLAARSNRLSRPRPCRDRPPRIPAPTGRSASSDRRRTSCIAAEELLVLRRVDVGHIGGGEVDALASAPMLLAVPSSTARLP